MHERLKLLLWIVFFSILQTKGKIADRLGLDEGEDNHCILCGLVREKIHHLFLRCMVSKVVWRESPWPLDIATVECDNAVESIRVIIHPKTTWACQEQRSNISRFSLPMQ